MPGREEERAASRSSDFCHVAHTYEAVWALMCERPGELKGWKRLSHPEEGFLKLHNITIQ